MLHLLQSRSNLKQKDSYLRSQEQIPRFSVRLNQLLCLNQPLSYRIFRSREHSTPQFLQTVIPLFDFLLFLSFQFAKLLKSEFLGFVCDLSFSSLFFEERCASWVGLGATIFVLSLTRFPSSGIDD